MKIVYIKLVNFAGVYAAMDLKELELSFDKIDKPIIQLYGHNGCGKSVLIQNLHCFSGINLDGDERNDLSLILPSELGIKNIVYEVDGELYNITHTYKPNASGVNHTVSSSIIHNGEELNPSGGVNVFNNIIYRILGINKYMFQFIINGTQLFSFANKQSTQRKTILNKAMGIDIYDKIHKLATDDHRYTNKLITSLNNTKEYLLSQYGSYETLCGLLNTKRQIHDELSLSISNIKSRLDQLSGTIETLRSQNIMYELQKLNGIKTTYENVLTEIGYFNDNVYDELIEEQIKLNNEISSLRNKRIIITKDIDTLYAEKNNIEHSILCNNKASNDYEQMIALRDDYKQKIDNLEINENITSSSNYLRNMISLGQIINGTCKEIVICIPHKHLILLTDMIVNGIDIQSFLMQESSILMDTEKEKTAVSRIRSMLSNIDGDYIDDCCHLNCIYRNTHNKIEAYFKSYQSVSNDKFSVYDIEQLEHVYKNIQSIQRIINVELSDELKKIFNLQNIMLRLCSDEMGVDVKYIQYLLEEAVKIEQRNRYVTQLNDTEKSIENMRSLINNISADECTDKIQKISDDLNNLRDEIVSIDHDIDKLTNELDVNDKHRLMISQIKNVNISDINNRISQLMNLSNQLSSSEQEYSELHIQYNNMTNELNMINNELETLENANNQYNTTIKDIDRYLESDNRYSIIAEATSSTKGKPVSAIKSAVYSSLNIANRLLRIMYDGEIELLEPVIDETTFTLPFRRGVKLSNDIRYGSQSESTLLGFVISLALSSSLTVYNIPLVDEIDGFLDSSIRDNYVLMLQEIMSVLKMEQLFLISHNITKDQYPNIVEVIDIPELSLKGGE